MVLCVLRRDSFRKWHIVGSISILWMNGTQLLSNETRIQTQLCPLPYTSQYYQVPKGWSGWAVGPQVGQRMPCWSGWYRCYLHRLRCVKDVVPGGGRARPGHLTTISLMPGSLGFHPRGHWFLLVPCAGLWQPPVIHGSQPFCFKGMAAGRNPVQCRKRVPFTKLNMLKASLSTSAS